MSKPSKNPALLWAAVIVDEMARAGMTDVVIAPGSRSTPLTLAFSAQSQIRVHSLIDERGAAFFALGLALESGRPAAVLCTSGTAAANFFPAVIEAAQSHVPLVVLTADRPAELRGTGANQTIDQVGMYGAYVRYAQDFLAPQEPSPALLMRYLRTSVDRALTVARAPVPGPVHLNIPFRKPLEPAAGESMPDAKTGGRADGKAFTQIDIAAPALRLPEIDWPARGLILAGPRCPGGDFPEALADLSLATGYPLIADALSGLRFGPWNDRVKVYNPQVCKAFLQGALPMPEVVLQFGAVPISNPAMTLLARLPADTPRVSVQRHGTWHDDTHGLTYLVHADPAAFCRALQAQLSFSDGGSGHAWSALEAAYWEAVDEAAAADYFEGLVLQDVVRNMPDDSLLFVANSLSVRHLDEWTRPVRKRISVFCNRGASGIDGTISTALGVAASAQRPLVMVLGDLAFYHDLNGLLALKRCSVPATIVLVNNDGGGIFRRLPVAAVEPPFTDMFLTPHGLDFSPAAEMFGAGFTRASNSQGLIDALKRVVGTRDPHIIEFRADSVLHEAKRLQIAAAWSEKIKKITGASPGNEQ